MQTIDLNLIPSGIAEHIAVNQFDVNRQFAIRVLDGITEYTIPTSNLTLNINGRKSDGNVFDYPATYTDPDSGATVTVLTLENNRIIVHTTMQMTAAAGECLTQIVLENTSTGQVLGTLNFVMDVQEMPAGTDLPSDSELPMIIAQAKEQEAHAAQSAAAAAQSALSASQSASSASDSKTDALSYKNAAEAARDRSETAADKAEEWSAHPPQVNENGNWDVWNIPDQQYEDSGIDCGPTITLDPDGAITMLDPDGTARIDNISQSDTDPVFHFYIPRGKGISSIVKTGTSGLTDTYTITYSDGATYTYNVVNGKTAYQSAVEGGYAGTEAQFESDLANFGPWATAAQNSATAAAGSATAAAGSASDASGYATAAAGSASAASTSETNAAASETAAAGSATAAATSETNAAASETAAAGSATNAAASATAAATSEDNAYAAYQGAYNAEQGAFSARTNCSSYASNAANSATNAAASESNAASSASAAAASAASIADVTTNGTVKPAINPTPEQISEYAVGAIWIETT